eukprot:CAMPEP_0183735760 /NCGR_PEP_ID=MMETSP0737-20130205/47558_1 /TAXON_ID=385413 /ORGANISM="Thalassiosira miniscula, Strain CCMP1093" /LENGTH=150 /DNA_ID=CAMNT_0025969593 /DNA_START=456 /DNA_END=908 /DNA_ORIENTATION=+
MSRSSCRTSGSIWHCSRSTTSKRTKTQQRQQQQKKRQKQQASPNDGPSFNFTSQPFLLAEAVVSASSSLSTTLLDSDETATAPVHLMMENEMAQQSTEEAEEEEEETTARQQTQLEGLAFRSAAEARSDTGPTVDKAFLSLFPPTTAPTK